MTTPTVDIELRNPTQVGLPALQQFAYSQEPPPVAVEPLVEYESWRPVIHRSAARVLVGMFVALMIGAVGFLTFGTGIPASLGPGSSITALPPSEAPVPPMVPVPDAVRKISGDELYNAILAAQYNIVPSDSQAASTGHEICGWLAAGWSGAQIEANAVAESHFADGTGVTPRQAHGFVAAAEQAICPEYTGK